MDKTQATELIDRHRRHSGTMEPPCVVARRVERNYFSLGAGFGVLALADLVLDTEMYGANPWRIAVSLGLLGVATLFFWQGRRFRQARKLIGD